MILSKGSIPQRELSCKAVQSRSKEFWKVHAGGIGTLGRQGCDEFGR